MIGAGVGIVLLVFAIRVCSAKARHDSAIERINGPPPPPTQTAKFECETPDCVARIAAKYAAGLEAEGRTGDAERVKQIAKALEAGDCAAARAVILPQESAQNAGLLLDQIALMSEMVNVCTLHPIAKRDAERAAATSDEIMIHAWLPESTLESMRKEAVRRDRSLSWCAQRVWEMSKADVASVRGADGGRVAGLPAVADGAEQPLIFPRKTLAEIDAEAERLGGTRGEIVALAWSKAGKRLSAADASADDD